MSFLDEVFKYKKMEISHLKTTCLKAKRKKFEGTPEQVLNYLLEEKRKKGLFVIAEVKKASPSEGVLNPNIDAVKRAKLYEINGASAISVLTESKWFRGNLEDLKKISSAVKIPVLMKDFVIDPVQLEAAFKLGASMVLLISTLLKSKLKEFIELSLKLKILPLVEVESEEELKNAVELGSPFIGVNCRNLRTLEVDRKIFGKLAPIVKKAKEEKGVVFVAESGMTRREEVEEVINLGYDGVLIGSRLSRSDGADFLKTIVKKSQEV